MKRFLIIFSILVAVLLTSTTMNVNSTSTTTNTETIYNFEEESYIDDIPFNTEAIVDSL